MTTKANLFQVEGQHTGLLIAVWLDPALANMLALPSGEPAEALHLTLCYCGDANEMSDVQIGRAIAATNETAMMFGPLQGQIAGLGRFNASESSDGKDVIYANVDVPGLAEMRQYLASSLEFAGCPPRRDHGYTPHVTLAYVEPGAPWPIDRIETLPITIRSLWIGVGDRRTEIPFAGSTAYGPYDGLKAGARHSRGDIRMLQTVHDHAVSLGASCGGKAAAPHAAAKAATVPAAGNALKAVRRTDTELRVANYMVLFGGRDLEGRLTDFVNDDGSRGQYFTKATKFDSPYTDLGYLYVDWEHGMDEDGPGRDEPLGYVDWKSARIDEKGLFVERVLNRRNKYVQYVEQLFDQGVFGASSEAIVEQVKFKANGEITAWPLRRDTITVNPMDPRQLSQNTLTAIKSLSAQIPALKALFEPAQEPEPEASTPGAAGGAAMRASQPHAADAASMALLVELDLLEID